MRAVWDEKSAYRDRRLMLSMAGEPQCVAERLAGLPWCDLRPEIRSRIRCGLKKFSEWARIAEGAI